VHAHRVGGQDGQEDAEPEQVDEDGQEDDRQESRSEKTGGAEDRLAEGDSEEGREAVGPEVGSSRSRSAATPVPPPQVVVIPSQNPAPSNALLYPPTLEPLAPRSRPFTIIGEDD